MPADDEEMKDSGAGSGAGADSGSAKPAAKRPTKKHKKKKKGGKNEEDDEPTSSALDEGDIALLKSYGLGPYTMGIKKVEKDIAELQKSVSELCGVKESDTGLCAPSQWDLVSDKQMMREPVAIYFYFCCFCYYSLSPTLLAAFIIVVN